VCWLESVVILESGGRADAEAGSHPEASQSF
jgi:hypothetical protein